MMIMMLIVMTMMMMIRQSIFKSFFTHSFMNFRSCFKIWVLNINVMFLGSFRHLAIILYFLKIRVLIAVYEIDTLFCTIKISNFWLSLKCPYLQVNFWKMIAASTPKTIFKMFFLIQMRLIRRYWKTPVCFSDWLFV